MSRICWLLGHKYVVAEATGKYAPEDYLNPVLGYIKVPYMVLSQKPFCVRCGQDRQERHAA